MMRPRTIAIWICVALTAAGLVPTARAADDTERFNGTWKTSFPYNGQTVTMVAVHEGSGFKNYVLLPNGAVPAGSGTFSAANGRWTASAAKPNDSGTYHFINENRVVCANAAGQTVVWERDDPALPPLVTPPAAPDYQQLMVKDRQEADAGDAEAMNRVGQLYENGQGVPRDYQQAMAWYRKAAAAGSSNAALQLGFIYGTGSSGPTDYQQAMTWYCKAADGGNAIAMRNIGILYAEGSGVPQDMNLAVQWYRKAALAGDQRSQEWLREHGVHEAFPTPDGRAPNMNRR